MTRLVGYTRELLPGEGTESDADELRRAGAVDVIADESADAAPRAGLKDCLESLAAGDTLLVTSAARLSPTVPHFLGTMSGLTSQGVYFRSLNEPALSTEGDAQANPAEVFAALDGLRRRLVSLRTRAGMASATTAGRRPGRPTVMTPERIAMAVELRNLGRPITHVARVLGVSPNAVQRALTSTSQGGAEARSLG